MSQEVKAMLSIEELLKIRRPIRKDLDYHSNKYLLDEYAIYHSRDTLTAIIQANKKLIKKTSNFYFERYRKYMQNRLDVDDLIACGNLGLMEAVEKFNFSQATEFSTYALHWIRQKILHEIFNNIGQCRIPTNLLQKIIMRPEKYPEVYYAYIHNISTDEQTENNEGEFQLSSRFGMYYGFGYERFSDPVVATLYDDLRIRLNDAVDILGTGRNMRIYKLRVGLVDGEVHTLEYVAKQHKITRERVRQICEKIDERLRIGRIVDRTDMEEWL